MAMDPPYISVSAVNSDLGMTSTVHVKIVTDESNLNEATLIDGIKDVITASGLANPTATKYSLTQATV
ncbi:hypothetical protein [Streptomyces sp. NPDC002994]|uniref:hypothetical protein n=1 Tax=Streptomyces sp. NPDC002994 TaxID=3154441 RepID=UPI0033AF7BB3